MRLYAQEVVGHNLRDYRVITSSWAECVFAVNAIRLEGDRDDHGGCLGSRMLIYSLGSGMPVSTNPPNSTAHPHTPVTPC